MKRAPVADPSGNGIAAAPDQHIATMDGIPPTLASSHYNTGTGILNMTFSEPLNGTAIGYDRIAVRDTGESSGGLALNAVANKTLDSSSTTITLTLSDGQRQTLNGMATPQLDIEEGAVADPSGNGIAAAPDQPVTVMDGIPPTLASSHYNTGTGILNMTFSEPLNGPAIRYDRLHVRDAGESSGGLLLGDVTARAVNPSSTTITLTLSDDQRQTLNSMAAPQLDIEEGAVADPSGNGIAAAPDQPITTMDGIPPTLASSHHNTGTGILNMTFSEPLNGTAIGYDRMAIRDTGESSGGLALNAVANKTLDSSSTTITLTLSDDQRQTLNSMTAPQLDIEEGAVADPSGNGIAAAPDQPVTVTDGIPPTLASSHYNTGTGILNITFSEPLNGTAIRHDRLHVRDAGQSSGGLSLGDVATRTVNPSSTTITLTLSDAQSITVNDMATPQLDIEEGAVADPSGNGIAAAPDQPVTVTDGIPPTLASSHYNTGTGILNMTFSEPLNGTAIGYDRMAIRDTGESSGGLALNAVANKTLDSSSTTITLMLSDAQRITVNGMATPQLDIEEGAVADPSGNGIAAAPDQPVTVIDGIPPTLASSHYNTGTGILNMTFSEPLNGTAIGYDRMAIRDTGESSGGLALDDVTTKALNANSITITLTLSDDQRQTLNSMTAPHLDIEAGAVADPSGNGIAAAPDQPVTVTDGIPPTLASSHYNTGTGILNITFSEPLNGTAIGYDRMAIRDTGESSGGLALDDVTTKALNANSITITLTLSDDQRQTLNSMTAPHLDIEAGAVADPSGNGIAAAPDQPVTVTDGIPPTLASSHYNTGTGILNITFSEPLNGTAIRHDRLHVRDAGQSSGGLSLGDVATRTVNPSSTTITLTLSDAQSITVNDMATPQLDIEEGAVADPSGNGIAAAPDQPVTVIDGIPPTLASSHYNTGTGILNMTFSEPLNGTAIGYDRMAVRDTGESSGGLALDEVATKALNANSITITLTLSDAQRITVNGMATPQLDIEEGAVADPSGNEIAAAPDQHITTMDGIPPTLASSHYNTGTGILNITFSEPLNGTAIGYDRMAVRDTGHSSGGLLLGDVTARAVDHSSTTITLTLSDAQRITVNGMTAPHLDIEAGAVADPSGNGIAAAPDRPITVTDITPPTLVSSKYYIGTGILNITFSEPLNGTAIGYDRMAVRDAGQSSGGLALNAVANKTLDSSSTTITLTLSDAQRITVNGMATPQLDIEAGAVADPSGNEIAAAPDQDITVIDMAPSADAGDPQTVTEGDVVTLNGARSSDIEGALSYLWAHTGGPAVTLSDATVAEPTFTAPHVGQTQNITFTLTVTDTGSLTDTANVTITVQDVPENDFVTTWETASTNATITIPVGGSTATYLIDWGDGTIENVSGDRTHTYADAGRHTIRISGDFERIYLAGSTNAAKLKSIDQWGSIKWSSMADAFRGANKMTYNARDTPDLSGVTDMSSMFDNAQSFNGDISSWDVSRVTDMSGMFTEASAFNQPLNNWNVSQVADTSEMFRHAERFNQDISDWNVSQVTDMSHMFDHASDFNQPLNNWDVSQVTSMSSMFSDARSFNGDISSWDVSQVTGMSGMFTSARAFNQPLNNWNVSQVTTMSTMFSNAWSFNQDISDWDVSQVTSMSLMFQSASRFNQPLNNWNVSQVTDMSLMFQSASRFNQPLNNWDVSQVTTMSHMFLGASDFEQNLGNWYITLDSTVIAAANAPGAVANITAQNRFLSSTPVTYEIRSGEDGSDSFNITDNKLYMTIAPDKTSYSVLIRSSASGEFGTDNHRLYTIMVSGPSADAGDPRTVTEGDTVMLDGTRSRDTEGGDSLTYLWVQTGGPEATLSAATIAEPTFTAPNVGGDADITFTLTVTDTNSLTDTDTVTITVNDVPNTAPSVDAGANQNVSEGDTVSLSGTASDADPEDTVLTYEWTHNATLTINLQNATALSTSFTAPNVSANTTVLFTLNVSDGTAHATDTVMIAIAGTNTPPSADAGDPQTVPEDELVTLDGTRSSDPEDGGSLSYLWTHTGGPRVTLVGPSTATPTFTAPDVAGDADITFTLTVTDSGSLTDTDNVTITVQDVSSDFVTMWETTSDNDTITIPVGGSTATYQIDWGDGTIEAVSGDRTHTYADAGFHTIRISGDFERIYLAGGGSANAAKLKSIDQWGSIKWSSMAGAFQHASEMTYHATDTPDLSEVTDMSAMFLDARSFNGDISSWDVSEVTDMSGMFLDAQHLTTTYPRGMSPK